MKEFLNKLKSTAGALSSLSLILPAYSFFTENAPPLFDAIGIICSALSFAFLYWGYKTSIKNVGKIKKLAKRYLIVSFFLIVCYLVLLQYSTIKISNSKDTVRYQIGFSLKQWSLTADGVKYLTIAKPPTSKQLLLYVGATEENVYFLWNEVYILLFGLANILLFCCSSFCWAYGWGLFVKLVP